MVQNQEGNHPKHWDKRGQVIECLPYRQYKVMLFGSSTSKYTDYESGEMLD